MLSDITMKNLSVVLLIVIVVSGCALVEMKKENETLRERITLKENQLGELERSGQRLFEKEQLLVKNLESKKLNLNQINHELDELIKANERLARLKHKRQGSVKEIEQAIQDMRDSKARAEEIEQQNASLQEKERKIQALREEIRQYLTIGLKSKYRPDQR